MAETHYQQLGVHPGASTEAIHMAWRIAVARHHPDRHTLDDDATQARCTERMIAINVAYQTLRDPARRRLYDLENGLIPATCHQCGQPGQLRPGQSGHAVALCNTCWHPTSGAVAL